MDLRERTLIFSKLFRTDVKVWGVFHSVYIDDEAQRGFLGPVNESAFKCFGTASLCQFRIVQKVLINNVKYMHFRQVHIPNHGAFLHSLTELIKTQAGSAGICRLISHSDISLT